jgi:RNA polymerase sigma factor (TIGR02999 family)
MMATTGGEVSRLLAEIAAGSESAKGDLFDCVYQELYAMAERLMKRERAGHTLGATGLVHEAYLRLSGQALERNRPYFFAAAANAMYRILVERARQSGKHHRNRIPLDAVLDDLEATHRVKMLDLYDSMETLKGYGERGRRQHEVIVQRFFGGLPWKEIAFNLDVSVATVEKDWQAARAWLYRRLRYEETA